MVKFKKLNSHIFLYFANTIAFNHYGLHVRGRPMAFMFSIETVVRGYHIYKEIWNTAIDGTELPCGREIVNAHDPFTIAIKKATPTGNMTVGHTPRVISSVCSAFICRGGTIVWLVNGARQYSSDLPWDSLTIQLRWHTPIQRSIGIG